jgi:CheY-like chemotaxis protein
VISGLKLLIADDSITIQKVVELTFLDEGMEVASAGDGDQALAKLEEFAPDVVLADVFMPGRTGYEVCEAIKQHERFHNIPVMLLVGSFEPFDEAEARRVGADDVLTKPFQSIRQLVNRVGTLLGGSPGDEANPRKLSTLGLEVSPQADPETVPTADLPESVEHAAGSMGLSAASVDEAEPPELMSTAEIELTTADTQPLNESHAHLHSESTAFAGDYLMANPATEPVVDMAEPFAAEVSSEFEDRTAWAERLASDSEPAASDGEIETPLPIEPMDYPTEQPQTAAGADEFDGLLDLGDLDATPVQPAYADSILDLEDEPMVSSPPDDSPLPVEAETSIAGPAPVVSSAPSYYENEFDPGWSDRATLTDAEKFAAIEKEADNREQIDVAAWEIVPSLVTVDESLDEPSAGEPAAQASMAPQASMSSADTGAPAAGRQLSDEDIDAIARRVVEHMSERIVREIAWEVVPELAELLIKRRMEES